MNYRTLPPRLKALLILQTLAAVGTAYATWKTPAPQSFGLLAFLVLFGVLGGACKVDLNVTFGVLSLGFTATYFALITLGTSEAMLVGLLGAFAAVVCNLRDSKRRFRLEKAFGVQAVYNYGNGVLATTLMGWVYTVLGGVPGRFDLSRMALPILASAVIYYTVNTGGVTLAIAWSCGRSVLQEFRANWAWTWPGYLAGACISAGLLWAYQRLQGEVGVFLLLPPAYLVYYFYRLRSDKVQSDIDHMRDLNRLNEAVIGSLAMAIEAKDRYTRKHVNRVREYSVGLGKRLGIAADELEAVRIAALLHDIGKIGIPESILCKPGKLTAEEYETIKSHVEIGAAILDRINFPWPVTPVVRSHHERWDGLGYPQGLKGDAIPIGGRIISLVDVYDALTTDRPYRNAIPREQAIQILRAGSGSQFDPVVVETFIALLPEMDEAIRRIQEDVDEEEEAFQAAMVSAGSAAPVAELDEAEDAAILQELANLASSGCGLVVMAPELAEKIEKLVPYSTCALFLKSVDQRNLIPIYGAGLWTELLEGIEIRVGEGVSGFTAARRESLMNVPAALDLARRLRPGDNLELNSTLCVPLMLGEEAVGTITLYHSSYNFYQPHHKERLQRIAEYAVQALEQSHDRQLELPLPAQDPTTGLPNHHSLLQFLAGQVHLAQTQESEFTLIQLALEASDASSEALTQALQGVARILRQTVREHDFVGRSSANSFGMVLSGCGEREAQRTARRILESAQAAGLSGSGTQFTLRAGIAVYRSDGAAPESLLETARARMADLGEIRPQRSLAITRRL